MRKLSLSKKYKNLFDNEEDINVFDKNKNKKFKRLYSYGNINTKEKNNFGKKDYYKKKNEYTPFKRKINENINKSKRGKSNFSFFRANENKNGIS